MSKNKKRKFKTTECQQGPAIDLDFDDLNKHEQAVVRTLATANQGRRQPKKIVDIMRENNWDKIGLSKGNSRVRNALRRLVRARLVEHTKEVGDGTYRISRKGLRRVSQS